MRISFKRAFVFPGLIFTTKFCKNSDDMVSYAFKFALSRAFVLKSYLSKLLFSP